MKNKGYCKAVDALIETAVKYADNVIEATGIKTESRRGADGKPYAFCLWTEQFHIAMGQLTKQAGLRK